MRLIVTSQQDIAGTNIYNELAKNFGFAAEGEFEGRSILKKGEVWAIATKKKQTEAEHLDEFFDAEYYVFASRHRSESKTKTLTVHVTGNLTSKALVGGKPKQLAYCNASAMKAALQELQRAKMQDYKVSMEATHHGPTGLKKPVLFVEVGSTEVEWSDAGAVRAVAGAALAAAGNRKEHESAVGIGGSHYAPRHTNVVLESSIAIGHIIPSYAIDEIDRDIFAQAVEKSNAAFGFLDWKGMKKDQRDKVTALAAELNLKLKRGRDLSQKGWD
jgi:D-aminoacyl-tRNA deacylase